VIVLVDPDDSFRCALAEMLRDDGHEILAHAAPSDVPPEDVARATALVVHGGKPDGVEFADRFNAAHAAAPVILTTSYSTAYLETQLTARPFAHLLRKPMEYATLARLLDA
jgi:FixJ family two-component response regulator